MQLIVLDIDNTLTASEYAHQTSFVKALEHFGIKEVNQDWGSYEHLTDTHILKVNYEKYLQQEFAEAMIPLFEERMMIEFAPMANVEAINGAQQLIHRLSDHGELAFVLATGSLRRPALLKLHRAGLDVPIELVSTCNDHFSRADIVTEAIEKAKTFYGIKDFSCIYSIGDGLWDMNTANELGLSFVGIGDANRKAFISAGVRLTLRDWNDPQLLNIFPSISI